MRARAQLLSRCLASSRPARLVMRAVPRDVARVLLHRRRRRRNSTAGSASGSGGCAVSQDDVRTSTGAPSK